jgi:hypothetical protein
MVISVSENYTTAFEIKELFQASSTRVSVYLSLDISLFVNYITQKKHFKKCFFCRKNFNKKIS